MQYDPSDSSGTDDDLPPTHQNRSGRDGRVSGNRRSAIAHSYPVAHNDMEIQIHQIEQEAYTSVLRAFKAQSDAISWDKESLITELRKELRVSDDEHRELLNIVNADDMIRRIREWRRTGAVQPGMLNNAQPSHDLATSPTVSNSRKRKGTTSIPLSLGAPSPHTHMYTNSMQPSSSAVQRGAAPNTKSKMTKSGQPLHAGSSLKSSQYPFTGPSGRTQGPKRSSSGAMAAAEVAPFDNLIGRKVMTRWPDDNNFYEAVITDYNANEGRHLLVYDINTNNETWEWVNLKEISPEDIRWEGEDPGVSYNANRGGPVHGVKKPTGQNSAVPNANRKGFLKNQSKKQFPPQNGIGKKSSGDIEILQTDLLIREVERVYNLSHPDPLELEKARKALREQEQALIDAITKLANVSDGESDRREEQDQGWRNQHGANYGDDHHPHYPNYEDGV